MKKSQRRSSRPHRPASRSSETAHVALPPALVALVAVVVTVAATIERLQLAAAWNETGSLTSVFYFGDANRFVNFAQAIVQGRPFDNGIPFHPPGWPLVMAGVMALAGVTSVPIGAIKFVVAAASGLSVGLAALLAYEMAGAGTMLAVAVLGAFHFGHMVEGTVANSEAAYGLFVVTAMWAAWRWLRDSRPRPGPWAVVAGVASGAAMLVRADFLAGAVLFGVAAWRIGGRQRAAETGKAVAVFALSSGLVLAPTTIQHWRALSAFNAAHTSTVAGPLPRLAPVTSYGPFNFAMANHEFSDGGPNRDHPLLDRCDERFDADLTGGELDLACPAAYELYVHGYGIGAAWLVSHPGAALDLITRKAGMAIGFIAHGYLIDNAGSGVSGVRRRVDLLDPAGRWLLPVHLLLLVSGIALFRRRTVALWILAAPLGALVASTVLFYGYVRLGVAYLPAVWILQGMAVAAAAQRATGARATNRRVTAAVLGGLMLMTAIDGVRARTPRAVVLEGARTPAGALMPDETVTVSRAPR